MASVALSGRRKRLSIRAPEEKASKIIQPPDIQTTTVLRKSDWIKIQDDLRRVTKEKQHLREAAKQREVLRLQSKEVVNQWSNTIIKKRQKKLEAKKIQEQIEEEERKQIEIEETKFKEQKQRETVEKARTQLYHQTSQVRRLHSALLLGEVLKQREAQTELKQQMQSASEDVDKKFLETVKTKQDEALKQEQEKALHMKLQRQAAAEDLKNQIKENEVAREQEKLDRKKDGEETLRLQELHLLEQKVESERQADQKRRLLQAHQDHLANKALIRVQEAEKQEAEEEQRKLFLSSKEKMVTLKKEREQELFREAQLHREKILNKLSIKQLQQNAMEEQRIAKYVAERDAKQAQLQEEEERKKSEMLKSITTHRELMRKEKEHRDKMTEQETREALQAEREADIIFLEKKQQKTEKLREEERKLLHFNTAQQAEKSARLQQLKEAERNFDAENAQLLHEKEKQFQQYSQHIIGAAVEAKRNLFPLRKAAKEGAEVGPIYLVQDATGARLPKYVSATTETVKKLRQPENIQESKKRLGFTW